MTEKRPLRSQFTEQASTTPGAAVPPRHYRRAGRRADDIAPEEPSMLWLITFTDIMGLMLTFFVLMFAMSTPSQEPFDKMTSALQGEFNLHYGRLLKAGPEDSIDVSRIDYDRALDIGYLEALMRSVVDGNGILKRTVTVNAQGDHLVLSLPGDLLFSAGRAEIREASARVLFTLGGTFSRMKNAMEFVGHTDPRPAGGDGAPYASNWEVSLARAVAVAAALDKVGYNQPVAVRGASSGRYQDMDGMVDENTRLDLSRRVDIDIMNHDGRRKKVPADLLFHNSLTVWFE